MAAPLQSINLIAPGFQGVNTEDSPLAQEASFAEVADNAIIDQRGRIAARKGYVLQTTDDTQLNSQDVVSFGKYKDDAGNEKLFFTGNNKILSNPEVIVDETPGAYTITDDDWKIVNFNDNLYFFQRGYQPLVYNNSLGAVTTMSTVAGAAGVTSAIYGNEVIGAWGRLWTADITNDKSTVYWSDLLQGHVWTGGSSGSVDISDVWPDGHDEIVALAAHNNLLIILGRHSIVVYEGANSPATMTLLDTITGVGCVNRDTVQYTGTDLLFISDTGLRSFGRVIQEKSLPISDRSRNVKAQLTALIQTEQDSFRSVYSPEESFYLITFVNLNTTYCFDLRGELENGSYRVTRWPSSLFTSFFRDPDGGTLWIGTNEGVSKYEGYADNTRTYRFKYESPALSFGDSSRLKMLKKIKATLVGGNGDVAVLSWGYDFNGISNYASIVVGDEGTAYYNLSEYGEALYTRGQAATRKSINASGSGEVVTVGFEVDVQGFPISIQELNVLAVIGKML